MFSKADIITGCLIPGTYKPHLIVYTLAHKHRHRQTRTHTHKTNKTMNNLFLPVYIFVEETAAAAKFVQCHLNENTLTYEKAELETPQDEKYMQHKKYVPFPLSSFLHFFFLRNVTSTCGTER